MKDTGSLEGPLSQVVARSLRQYLDDLDGQPPADVYAMVLREVERPMLTVIMEHTAQNQSRAAEMLGINRNTLRKKLKSHGLDRGSLASRLSAGMHTGAAPAQNQGFSNYPRPTQPAPEAAQNSPAGTHSNGHGGSGHDTAATSLHASPTRDDYR